MAVAGIPTDRPRPIGKEAAVDERDGWWRFAEAVVGGLFRSLFRLHFTGLEHLPATTPAIVAANHVSVLDPIAIALAVVSRGRAIRFLTALEFFEHPVWGPPLRIMKQVPIRRGARDRAALEEVGRFLRGGGVAGIFPEGRVGEGVFPLKGSSGVARLSVATGAPVVPAGVWGTQARWPRGRLRIWPLRRFPIAVTIGEPIFPGSHANPGRVEYVALTRAIMSAIEEQVRAARSLTER